MSLSRTTRPRLLEDFLIFHLEEGTFRDKLSWVDRNEKTFRISWRHQSSSRFTPDDTCVFQAWAVAKQLWDPTEPKCHTKAKQRLRAALLKLRSVTCVYKDNESRIYRITRSRVQQERPDQIHYSSQSPPSLPSSPVMTPQFEDGYESGSSSDNMPQIAQNIEDEEMQIDFIIEQILRSSSNVLQQDYTF